MPTCHSADLSTGARPHALRGWVKQAAIDGGRKAATSKADAQRISLPLAEHRNTSLRRQRRRRRADDRHNRLPRWPCATGRQPDNSAASVEKFCPLPSTGSYTPDHRSCATTPCTTSCGPCIFATRPSQGLSSSARFQMSVPAATNALALERKMDNWMARRADSPTVTMSDLVLLAPPEGFEPPSSVEECGRVGLSESP